MNYIKLTNNTHDYDNQLKIRYKELREIDKINLIEPDTFDNTIQEIYKDIRKKKYSIILENALKSLYLFNYDRKNNYDSINDINIEILLPLTWRFIKHYDDSGKILFYEQLSEIITNGSCPQGRVTRIFQFYSNHIESKDEIYCKNLI